VPSYSHGHTKKIPRLRSLLHCVVALSTRSQQPATFLLLPLVMNPPTNPTRCSTPAPIRPPPRPCSRTTYGCWALPDPLWCFLAPNLGAVHPDLGKGPVLADFRYDACPILPYWSVCLCFHVELVPSSPITRRCRLRRVMPPR
jgi:hypothetical protein